MNAALILSGGAGRRFGSALPKQYHKIGGRTVIEYVLDAAANARLVDRVMVAGADCPQLRALAGRYAFDRAPAGAVRNETLRHGLDALNALGYSTKTLDGIFGANTETALRAFQRSNGLTADGICGCNSWRKLANAAVGIGRTQTVID